LIPRVRVAGPGAAFRAAVPAVGDRRLVVTTGQQARCARPGELRDPDDARREASRLAAREATPAGERSLALLRLVAGSLCLTRTVSAKAGKSTAFQAESYLI
jgi:hypothetical protein